MNCNSCGNQESSFLWNVRGYDLYRCSNCGLIFADIRQADLSGIYEEDYYRKVYPDYESDRDIHCKNFAAVLDRLERMAHKGALLEVGSAFGFFLDCARRRGWDVHGYEVSQYASLVAKTKYKADVTNADFLSTPTDKVYDCVCVFDTIEHVTDPDALVRKVASVLKPGGYLVITTGDMGSFMGRVFGKLWRMVHPPFHLYYYSARSLGFLLRKHAFSVVSVSHDGKYYNVGSALQLFFRIPKSVLPQLALKINLADIMTVIARKDDAPSAGLGGGV